jgi:hypothetical protein
MYLSTMVQDHERHIWVPCSYWTELRLGGVTHRKTFFTRWVTESDLQLLKNDPQNKSLIDRTLGFRGQLQELRERTSESKWDSALCMEILRGYFVRRDLDQFQTFLRKMKGMKRKRGPSIPLFRQKLFEVIEKWFVHPNFLELEPFFSCLIEFPPPLRPNQKSEIVYLFQEQSLQIFQRVKDILQYEDENDQL